MNLKRVYAYLFVGCVCLIATGCSDSGYDLANVAGKVTLDGEALPGALVVLQPTGGGENPGPGSTGLTDSEGNYSVRTIQDENGAVVGRHRVSIVSNPNQEARASDTDEGRAIERVPPRYNLLSELTLEVPSGGTDAANFDLTTSGN